MQSYTVRITVSKEGTVTFYESGPEIATNRKRLAKWARDVAREWPCPDRGAPSKFTWEARKKP